MDSALPEHDPVSARYGGLDRPPTIAAQNAVLDTMLAHSSARAFTPAPLPADLLETLVAAAQSAPTSSNLQTWSVVAVTDPARKQRLAVLAANQGFVAAAPVLLCFVADLSRLDRLGEANGRPLEGLRYLETFLVAALDAGFAAQNLLVAAEASGLGTCYVGAMRNRPDAVAAELGLPPSCMVVFGLCLGYPAADGHRAIKPRLPQQLVLHHEHYTMRDEKAIIDRYDAVLSEFSARNGMGQTAWTPRVLARVADAKALSGRDRMRAVLNEMGFGLK